MLIGFTKRPVVNVRPEDELLLCCARTQVDARCRQRVYDLLQTNVDWGYLIKIADQHGVLPLLYHHLSTSFAASVPKNFLDRLRSDFERISWRNLHLAGVLRQLDALFQAHGIRVITYKGPVLAASTYNNLLLRRFYDLDLLIHEQDFFRLKQLLVREKYHPYFPFATPKEGAFLHTMTPAWESIFVRLHWEYHLVRDDDLVSLDLHWRVLPKRFPFPITIDDAWHRTESVRVAGHLIRTFRPDDMLLILCLHGAKDHWVRLDRVCDVAEQLRAHPEIDLTQLIQRSRRLGYERIVLLGLYLAHDLLDASLPQAVVDSIHKDRAVSSLAYQVRKQLFQTVDALPEGKPVDQPLFQLRLHRRLRDKVRYVLDKLLAPTVGDWAVVPLPSSLIFLYYIFHPIRLASTYGVRALKQRFRSAIMRSA